MEPFIISLSNSINKRSKYQPYYFALLGLIYTVFGILNLTQTRSGKFGSLGGWFWILTGCGFIIGSFYTKKYSSKYFLELGKDFIQVHPSFNKNIKIPWNKIEQIHIKPISFEFILKNGSTESISLGNVAYKDVIETKEKLKEFAQHDNIKIY